MAAPNASPFDLSPARRPNTDDFNGIAKEDDDEDPPNPREQPNAGEWNTIEWILMSLGRVMPVVVISVVANVVTQVTAAGKDLDTTDFALVVNGTGDVSITWPANSIPSSVAGPVASLNTGPGMIHAALITNGVQVKTYDGAGSPADQSFTVQIF